MLKNLRLKLTLLYLLAGAALMVLLGSSSYSLLYYYFQNTNDLALNFKMALTFKAVDAPLTPELENAELIWMKRQGGQASAIQNLPDDESDDDEKMDSENMPSEEAYKEELSAIFVFPLDTSGALLINPNPFPPPMQPDHAAVQAALEHGFDLRTVTLADGSPVRLLTYALPPGSGFDLVQLGRPFGDQVRVLYQFLTGLLSLGAVIILALGAGSWWMAGKSLAQTQKAWENQQIFIANASHELRTPLTLIRASSEVAMRHTSENTQQRELLADIVVECDHMTRLVEDLLLLSRLDTKKLKVELQPIPLENLVGDVLRQFECLAEERGVTLTGINIQGKVLGDRTWTRQVLLILLDNALRHTPPGGSITISSSNEGRSMQRIQVIDTGEGIIKEHLEHVFDRFYQAPSSVRGEGPRGNGLGLAIARSLVEAQNGKIGITSALGKGTTVSFFLPRIKV